MVETRLKITGNTWELRPQRNSISAAAQDWAADEAASQWQNHAALQGSRIALPEAGPLAESCERSSGLIATCTRCPATLKPLPDA